VFSVIPCFSGWVLQKYLSVTLCLRGKLHKKTSDPVAGIRGNLYVMVHDTWLGPF